MPSRKAVEIIGVPSDLGANMRGSNMGPSALRIAGLKRKIEIQGYGVTDLGDLPVPVRDSLSDRVHEQMFLEPLVDVCQALQELVHSSIKRSRMPLVIGGDHSIAIGTISGLARYHHERGEKLGVVWVDAHADINTPDTSPSGNIHGMPLATLLGKGHSELVNLGYDGPKLEAENVALIGIRTIDEDEKAALRDSGINYFSMRDVDEKGMFRTMREAIETVTTGTAAVHVSFDLDGIDPRHAPGVSTPVSGGLTFREAHLALEMLFETKKLQSMEFVELNPYTDVGAQSANLCVDLILSALGKSIV